MSVKQAVKLGGGGCHTAAQLARWRPVPPLPPGRTWARGLFFWRAGGCIRITIAAGESSKAELAAGTSLHGAPTRSGRLRLVLSALIHSSMRAAVAEREKRECNAVSRVWGSRRGPPAPPPRPHRRIEVQRHTMSAASRVLALTPGRCRRRRHPHARRRCCAFSAGPGGPAAGHSSPGGSSVRQLHPGARHHPCGV